MLLNLPYKISTELTFENVYLLRRRHSGQDALVEALPALQCVAVCCSGVAVRCSTLTAASPVLQCVAKCCSVVAVRCSALTEASPVLQCVAVLLQCCCIFFAVCIALR